MTAAHVEGRNLDTETDTHLGRMPRENQSKGQGDVSTLLRMPKITSKPPEAR